jgi:hypothetical protein
MHATYRRCGVEVHMEKIFAEDTLIACYKENS